MPTPFPDANMRAANALLTRAQLRYQAYIHAGWYRRWQALRRHPEYRDEVPRVLQALRYFRAHSWLVYPTGTPEWAECIDAFARILQLVDALAQWQPVQETPGITVDISNPYTHALVGAAMACQTAERPRRLPEIPRLLDFIWPQMKTTWGISFPVAPEITVLPYLVLATLFPEERGFDFCLSRRHGDLPTITLR